mgnify:CR=1 FL=1
MKTVNWNCEDCGKNTDNGTDYYMVEDDIWAKYGPDDKKDLLCISCLERRMGRPLEGLDIKLCHLTVDMNTYTRHILMKDSAYSSLFEKD